MTQEKERKPGAYHVKLDVFGWVILTWENGSWFHGLVRNHAKVLEVDESPITREKPDTDLIKTFRELIHVFESTLPSDPDKDAAELIERCKSVASLTPSKESEPSFDRRAESYYNSLSRPLANEKGLVETAYTMACIEQKRIDDIELQESFLEGRMQNRQIEKLLIGIRVLKESEPKTDLTKELLEALEKVVETHGEGHFFNELIDRAKVILDSKDKQRSETQEQLWSEMLLEMGGWITAGLKDNSASNKIKILSSMFRITRLTE